MIFTPTKIQGAYLIKSEKKGDSRGYLFRTFCADEFLQHGIKTVLRQGYISYTEKKGTLRGFHYQTKPYAEDKLTRCIKGSIWEGIIDLRPKSKTYLKWEGYILHAHDQIMLFTPGMCAHAILSLEDNTYFMNFSSTPFMAKYEKGIRYNDPFFRMKMPISIKSVSKKDLSWEDLK